MQRQLCFNVAQVDVDVEDQRPNFNAGGRFTLSPSAVVDRPAWRCNGHYSAEAGGGGDAHKCAESVHYMVEALQGSRLVASHRFLQS